MADSIHQAPAVAAMLAVAIGPGYKCDAACKYNAATLIDATTGLPLMYFNVVRQALGVSSKPAFGSVLGANE